MRSVPSPPRRGCIQLIRGQHSRRPRSPSDVCRSCPFYAPPVSHSSPPTGAGARSPRPSHSPARLPAPTGRPAGYGPPPAAEPADRAVGRGTVHLAVDLVTRDMRALRGPLPHVRGDLDRNLRPAPCLACVYLHHTTKPQKRRWPPRRSGTASLFWSNPVRSSRPRTLAS